MNNGLSQLGTQLLAIWKQLGVNQRVSLALAALAVVLGLGGLALWSSRPDYALLYGKLDEAEAAKVVATLDETKIPYRISRGGGTISVPANKVHVIRMQLAAKGIPRGEGVGFEIFDKPNFGISDFVQRANYLRAVQGELARTIGQVDSIENARVMIVLPENRLFIDNHKRPTASVFVRVRGNASLPPQTVNAIRFLVANSVEGLSVNNVSVVDNQGNVLSDNNENDSVAGLTNTQLTARKNLEQYLAKKAEGMLDKVLGPGQSVVRVATEINFDSLSRVEEKFDPEGQVVRSSIINDENVDSTNANLSGAPGIVANSPVETNTTAYANSPLNTTHTRKKVTNNQYDINKTVSNLMQTPGSIKRLSAAIFIAAQVSGAGTNRTVSPRCPEEMQKLRRIVQSALGIQEGADPLRRDEITVEEIPFNDQPAVELTQQLEKQRKQQQWFDIGKNAFYPLLAIGILFFFWRAFKRTPGDTIPIGVPIGELTGRAGNGHTNGNGQSAKVKSPPGIISIEVLNQLIRENPNNMTQAIRTWMAGDPRK
jgi:flagellar M-ring protein FliF